MHSHTKTDVEPSIDSERTFKESLWLGLECLDERFVHIVYVCVHCSCVFKDVYANAVLRFDMFNSTIEVKV